ncbi:TELO2-interacting protein 2 [Protopterus annectens]|uniref:TELO2-interacting protein 2 n=1 Tax=Protopterus annectens TaxID=7888 RepID=UPI001CFC036A|nr:TELO2-interacting protein 2 [Protopterus annectens]
MELAEFLEKLKLTDISKLEDAHELHIPPSGKVFMQIQELFQATQSKQSRYEFLKDIRLLFETADSHWLFGHCCSNRDFDLSKVYGNLVTSLIQYAALPVCENDISELPESAFSDIPEKAETVVSCFLVLIQKLLVGKDPYPCGESGESTVLICNSTVVPFVVFAATHCHVKPWTSFESRSLANRLLNEVLKMSGSESLAQLLMGKNDRGKGIVGSVLQFLRPELQKHTWKLNPATKHVFFWILCQITRPWLANHLERVLPPALLISDDYRIENKVMGVRCIHHIIVNVPAADLWQFNRAQVLYHALFNHLYTHEADLIQVVLPCLLDLLPIMEKSSVITEKREKTTYTDEVLRLVLTHMEMENKIALRRVYAKNLPCFVERLGISTARHLKRLEKVIVGYLEVYDGPEEEARLCVLETLKCTIQHVWPRIPSRLEVFLKSLLKLIYDVSTDSSLTSETVKSSLLQQATQCLILLDRCSEHKVKVLLDKVQRSCNNADLLKSISEVQKDAEITN